ncbi:malignant fibrous histiocytoma-amplified sequence 1 homolog isoform X1 [Littorina saxatilis]|uniref:malignant fibrous histiocytoma-amplified sequence 1 homolog isoform X1 n=1 Tax=Littorina saxatilis TaxID=31220 RepID=UPI0038B55CF8
MATRTKTRGTKSAPYRGPYGTPLAHVHYREGRHLEPGRIPFRRHEVPVSLRLLDVSKESLENVRQVATSIKRLMAPSLKLQMVPDSLIAYLEHLERLDLGHNHLSDASFPDAMKSLELLIELRLNDNQLTRVPACLRGMRNLCRLDLSNNQLDTALGLEKLKKLQFLVLDSNNLNTVFKDISSLKKLEMLRVSSNNLRDVPRDIRNLRHLRDLDISNNRIVLLPPDVFQLPRLECFNASQNQVGKVPSFNVKGQNRHWIASVDLSDNNLVKFPGHLMHLSRRLDLASNKIRTLSWAALKKLDGETDQELLLDSNPLIYPPQDVCESGLKTIMDFFQESQADVKTYQGVKVLVVGSHRSGKSSLIHSLVDNQSRLSDDVTETAAGIDAYEMSFDYDVEDGKPVTGKRNPDIPNFGKSLNLCLWDFCGDPFYLYPHYLFHEQPSITVLTFSMADYSTEHFNEHVGSWFDWMIAKTNKLVVVLVGTKSDKVTAKRASEITREVRERLGTHLEKRQTMIESRIKEIETRPVISPTLSESLKTYMKLLQAKFTVQTEVTTTSCKTFHGFDKLREAIEALANDRKLFPNVMRVIPTFWVEVENWLEERGNALVVPVMPWDEFSEEVTSRFGMKHLLISITQYLHESGKVLWFSNAPNLKEIVFLRPTWLFDVLKQVFRHDLESVAFTPDDTLKAIAFTASKFERLKQELLAEGVVDRELLKGLLVSVMPADINKPSIEVLQILTQRLEMGYPVSKRSRDTSYNLAAEKDAEGNVKVNRLLIPWFRRSAEPDSFRKKWRELRDRRRLSVLFKFPCYMPPGLFELMTVRAHAEKHKLVFLAHWGGGVHAGHSEEKVQLLITYFREGRQELGADDDDEESDENTGEDRDKTSSHGSADSVTMTDGNDDKLTHVTSDDHAPLSRQDSADSVGDSEDSGSSHVQPASKRNARRSMGSVHQPETIEELDEEEDDEEEEDEDTLLQSKDKRTSGSPRNKMTKDKQNSDGQGQNSSKDEERAEGIKVAKRKASATRTRRPTECDGNDDGPVILKLEIRDNSDDKQDQTPAASMWNILLPLLTDFEDLLTGYTGVLVERRTECPLCGEASFLGEWLTPKETQGMNTRTCDACQQHVDTSCLVQPREKKRVVINRNRFRRPRTSDTPPVNGEVNMTSCAPSSDAASDGVAPP